MKWRDISSAPKDGSSILARGGDIIEVVWWCEEVGWRNWEEFGVGGSSYPFEPNFWLPIPEEGIDSGSYNQALIDVDCMVCDAFDYPVIWRIYRKFSKMVSRMMIRDDKGRMI